MTLERILDERFLAHRRRSTSTAGMITAAGSLLLFEYRLVVSGTADWDLLAIGVTFVVVKIALMGWYAARD
ncbi:MAG: hypothetical protein ABJC89_10585 [Acidobacteriota bacterium]